MNDAKYVVMKNDEINMEKMIVFDNSIRHDKMARGLVRITKFTQVASAGFISEFGTCYGESTSLRIKSRPEKDSILYRRMMGLNDKEIIFKK